MEGGVLGVAMGTRTLSLVLAMSRGLQTVTEIMPATRPERKLWNLSVRLLVGGWQVFISNNHLFNF